MKRNKQSQYGSDSDNSDESASSTHFSKKTSDSDSGSESSSDIAMESPRPHVPPRFKDSLEKSFESKEESTESVGSFEKFKKLLTGKFPFEEKAAEQVVYSARYEKEGCGHQLILQALDQHQRWLKKGEKIERPDLKGINMRKISIGNRVLCGGDFEGGNFRGCLLYNISFAGCDLSDTQFNNSCMVRCDFSHAHMANADFSNAVMIKPYFNLADITGSTFNKTIIYRPYFISTNFRDVKITSSILLGTKDINSINVYRYFGPEGSIANNNIFRKFSKEEAKEVKNDLLVDKSIEPIHKM